MLHGDGDILNVFLAYSLFFLFLLRFVTHRFSRTSPRQEGVFFFIVGGIFGGSRDEEKTLRIASISLFFRWRVFKGGGIFRSLDIKWNAEKVIKSTLPRWGIFRKVVRLTVLESE